jgi:hypothetical protein
MLKLLSAYRECNVPLAPVTVAAPPSNSNEHNVALAPKADEPNAALAPKADEPDVALAPKAADQGLSRKSRPSIFQYSKMLTFYLPHP